jgi:hypothetical protein
LAGADIPVDLASEADTAQPVTPNRDIPAALVTETDLAQPVTPQLGVKIIPAGLTTEADTVPGGLTHSKALTPGLSTETDTALSVTPVRSYAVVQPSETDTVPGVLTHSKAVTPGLTTETDTVPGALTHSKSVTLGIATEADSALPASPTLATLIAVDLVTELDSALPLTFTGGSIGLDGAPGSGRRHKLARRIPRYIRLAPEPETVDAVQAPRKYRIRVEVDLEPDRPVIMSGRVPLPLPEPARRSLVAEYEAGKWQRFIAAIRYRAELERMAREADFEIERRAAAVTIQRRRREEEELLMMFMEVA